MNADAEFETLLAKYSAYYCRGDAEGCASLFTPDAAIYSSYAPTAVGVKAIRELHEGWVSEDGAKDTEMTLEYSGASGDVGWCFARFEERSTILATSLKILSKQPDGRWLINRCSLNAVSG